MQILHEQERDFYLHQYDVQQLCIPLDHAEVHKFNRGEFIIHEGTTPSYLYYLIEGRCKIIVTHENGKTSIIHFIGPGDFIGELELVDAAIGQAKAIQATRTSYCIAFPVHLYRQRLLENNAFLVQLVTFLSKKLIRNGSKISQIQAYPLEHHLAQFILVSAQQDLYQERHTEVCDYLGVSYRHLLHTLAQFCDKGFLQKEQRAYRILNRQALKDLADVLLPQQ